MRVKRNLPLSSEISNSPPNAGERVRTFAGISHRRLKAARLTTPAHPHKKFNNTQLIKVCFVNGKYILRSIYSKANNVFILNKF